MSDDRTIIHKGYNTLIYKEGDKYLIVTTNGASEQDLTTGQMWKLYKSLDVHFSPDESEHDRV